MIFYLRDEFSAVTYLLIDEFGMPGLAVGILAEQVLVAGVLAEQSVYGGTLMEYA